MNEPVMWWDGKDLTFKEKHFDQLMPLYTHPVKELTDEEISEVFKDCTKDGILDANEFARAILRKVSEK
jgi:SOS response regulatory protein OraA/RecX